MDTSIPIKKKYFPKFTKWMWRQAVSGGKRYQLGENKEMTDIICEIGGSSNWMLQNAVKYICEYINTKREVCLVKAAVYLFLAWIKDQGTFTKEPDKGEE